MRFTQIILALYFATLTIPNMTIFLDESTPESLEFKNKLLKVSTDVFFVVFVIVGFSLLFFFRTHVTKGILNTYTVFGATIFLTGLLTSGFSKYFKNIKWLLALLLLVLEIAQMYALSLLLQKAFPFEHTGMYHLHSL